MGCEVGGVETIELLLDGGVTTTEEEGVLPDGAGGSTEGIRVQPASRTITSSQLVRSVSSFLFI